ncbi:hypothetical protein D3C80_1877870 [compost metagenome]
MWLFAQAQCRAWSGQADRHFRAHRLKTHIRCQLLHRKGQAFMAAVETHRVAQQAGADPDRNFVTHDLFPQS